MITAMFSDRHGGLGVIDWQSKAAHERARGFEALISLTALNPGYNQKRHEWTLFRVVQTTLSDKFINT